MKYTAFAFFALIVGSIASPAVPVIVVESPETAPDATNEPRVVTGQIIQAIEQAAQNIRDAGLDPFNYKGSIDYQLPVPVLFNANAFIESLTFTGLSNIAINSMQYSIITNRLTFNLSLPRLSLRVVGSGFKTIFFGDKYTGSFRGSLDVVQPRIVGNIRVNVGVISGISIRSIDLIFSLARIESNLNLNLFNFDLSQRVNRYLGTTLPSKIARHAREINELLETLAWRAVNENF